MTPQQGKKFIFISYAHKDSRVVMPLIQGMMARNFNVWYDDSFEAGSEWPEYIATNLLASECVIVFMSPNADASHNCRQELTYAINKRKKLIVVYLENFQPSPGTEMQLDNLQALYRSNYDSNEAFLDYLVKENKLLPCQCIAETTTPQPLKASSSITHSSPSPQMDVPSFINESQSFVIPPSEVTTEKTHINVTPLPDKAATGVSSTKRKALTTYKKKIKGILICSTCILQFLNFFILWRSFSNFEELSSNALLLALYIIFIPFALCLLNAGLFILFSQKLPYAEADKTASLIYYCWEILLIITSIYGGFHINFTESFLVNLIVSYCMLCIPQGLVMRAFDR